MSYNLFNIMINTYTIPLDVQKHQKPNNSQKLPILPVQRRPFQPCTHVLCNVYFLSFPLGALLSDVLSAFGKLLSNFDVSKINSPRISSCLHCKKIIPEGLQDVTKTLDKLKIFIEGQGLPIVSVSIVEACQENTLDIGLSLYSFFIPRRKIA